MMMIYQGSWIVRPAPTPSRHPRQDINVFTTGKNCARAKALIKSLDRLKSRPTTSEICPVNQARRDEFAGRKVLSVGLFLDGNPVILRIVEQNPSADEPESGIFFEAAENRVEKVIGRVTVVVCENDYLSLRQCPSQIARPTKAGFRLYDGFWTQPFPIILYNILRLIVRSIVYDY
jgi:hypothetical protein